MKEKQEMGQAAIRQFRAAKEQRDLCTTAHNRNKIYARKSQNHTEKKPIYEACR